MQGFDDDHKDGFEEVSKGKTPDVPQRHGFDPDALRKLRAFKSLQRQIAGINFPTYQLGSASITALIAAQDKMAQNIAQSINFSGFQAVGMAIAADIGTAAAIGDQHRWVQTMAASIDLSALQRASKALAAFNDAQKSQAEALAFAIDFTALTDKLTFAMPNMNFGRLREVLDRWIPHNLKKVGSLDAVAQIALDEGIPLSWIPRQEIVEDLVAADGPDQRMAILDGRFADILYDCEVVLANTENEWARQCLAAISALRDGFDGPAQSHGANIIDSIIFRLLGKNGREDAKQRAEEEFDDLSFQVAAESLTFRPLFRALTAWWPTSGDAPPDHFARHATAHAVGHEGVFERRHAIVAVMLATSLTVQFSDELSGESGPPPPI